MSHGTVEVLIGRERRRRWDVAEKLRIVAESNEPGASVRAVAARHDVYPSLLHTWRRQVRTGRLVPRPMAGFVPVRMAATPPVDGPGLIPVLDQPRSGTIEISLPDGSQVLVGNDVSLAALRRVITALRG